MSCQKISILRQRSVILSFMTVFKTSDTDELEELSRADGWDIRYLRLKRGSFTAKFRDAGYESIIVNEEYFENKIQIIGHPKPGVLSVGISDSSIGQPRWMGKTIQRHDLMLSDCAGGEVDFISSPQQHLCSALIQWKALLKTAESLKAESLLNLPEIPTKISLTENQLKTLHACFRSLIRGKESKFVTIEAEAMMLAMICSVLQENQGQGAFSSRQISRKDSAEGALIARNYMEERYKYPLRLEQLCEATRLPPRALQRGFNEVFGISPMAYLRQLRLNNVHRLLLRDEKTSVTAAALRCGFTHLSRFSMAYYQMFGELPRETMRKSKYRRAGGPATQHDSGMLTASA